MAAEKLRLRFPVTVLGAITTGVSASFQLHQPMGKGYEITGVAAGFTGTAALQGSVGGNVWTDLLSPIVDGQAAIANQYNRFRLNVTVVNPGDVEPGIWIVG